MLSKEYYKQLTDEKVEPEKLIEKSFKFLLKNEKQKDIIEEFELSEISKYFPKFEQEIKERIKE